MPKEKKETTSKEKVESPSIVKKLDRSKLHKVSKTGSTKSLTEDKGSVRAIVILIVIIIVVAVGGAFLVKSIKTSEDNPGTEIDSGSQIPESEDGIPSATPEYTESLEDKFLSDIILKDTDALDRGTETDFVSEDSEFINDGTSSYILATLSGQPYETFYRVSFTFESDDEAAKMLVPGTKVNYRSVSQEIELTFSDIQIDDSALEVGDSLAVINSSLATIVKSNNTSIDTGELVYQLKLNDNAPYYAQVIDNQLIIDIQEDVANIIDDEEIIEDEDAIIEDDIEETEDETSEENAPSAGATEYKVDIEGNTNEDNAAIIGFTYDDTPEKFDYQLKLADNNIPKVSSKTDSDGSIIVKIENLRFDALPKDGSGFTNFAEAGVVNVESVTISNGDGVSTYEFKLSSPAKYSVNLDKTNYDENRIVLEIFHKS